MQDYALCVRPFCPFLHRLRVTHLGLAWEGSPVASQRSYGGYQRAVYLRPAISESTDCTAEVNPILYAHTIPFIGPELPFVGRRMANHRCVW